MAENQAFTLQSHSHWHVQMAFVLHSLHIISIWLFRVTKLWFGMIKSNRFIYRYTSNRICSMRKLNQHNTLLLALLLQIQKAVALQNMLISLCNPRLWIVSANQWIWILNNKYSNREVTRRELEAANYLFVYIIISLSFDVYSISVRYSSE